MPVQLLICEWIDAKAVHKKGRQLPAALNSVRFRTTTRCGERVVTF